MAKPSPLQQLETELTQATEQQRKKTLALAQQVIPGVTPEDIRNPNDFPKLMQYQPFQFEDGVTSGLLAALTLVKRFIKDNI